MNFGWKKILIGVSFINYKKKIPQEFQDWFNENISFQKDVWSVDRSCIPMHGQKNWPEISIS
jgi:hypothetical protein